MWVCTRDQQKAHTTFRVLKVFIFLLRTGIVNLSSIQRLQMGQFPLSMNGSGMNTSHGGYETNRKLLSLPEIERGHALLCWAEGHQLTSLSLTHLDRSLAALLFSASMVPLLALGGRSCLVWKLESLVFEKERGLSYMCWGHNVAPEFHSNHLAFTGRGYF